MFILSGNKVNGKSNVAIQLVNNSMKNTMRRGLSRHDLKDTNSTIESLSSIRLKPNIGQISKKSTLFDKKNMI